MSKKKRQSPKNGPVWHRSAVEATLDRMPKYNAFACGNGPHGDTKYNRAKQKSIWQQEITREGARECGLLPFPFCEIKIDTAQDESENASPTHPGATLTGT